MKLDKKSELKIAGVILVIYVGIISAAFFMGKAIGTLIGAINEMHR